MAALTIKGRYTVIPAEPTWSGSLYLSEFDQTLGFGVPTVRFYRAPPLGCLSSGATILSILRDSLSVALVHFYPLAGRLSPPDESGRLRIDCNAAGAVLVEARSESGLDDFGDFSEPREEFNGLTPFLEYGGPLSELPLLLAQVTEFRCGGIALGVTISHAAADGLSAFRFLTEWARLARGEPVSMMPFHDRTLLIPNEETLGSPLPRFDHPELDPLPHLIGQLASDDDEKSKKTAVAMLQLTKSQVEKLKEMANVGGGDGDRPYSRYEAIAAHVWRTTCKARAHEFVDQPTVLSFMVDFRSRIQPPLPPGYFGNAVIDMTARSESGKLTSNPLSYAASQVKKVIDTVRSDYVWSAMEAWREKKSSQLGRGGPGGNPNIGLSSWLRLPMYGLDFGWGEEIRIGLGTGASDGNALIMPGNDGAGSAVVANCLQAAHMEAFKKFFYDDIKQDDAFALE